MWLRLTWVGYYEERRGRNWEWFFQVDLAPAIGYSAKHMIRESEHICSIPCGPMLEDHKICLFPVILVATVPAVYLSNIILTSLQLHRFPDWARILVTPLVVFLMTIISSTGVAVVGSLIFFVATKYIKRWF